MRHCSGWTCCETKEAELSEGASLNVIVDKIKARETGGSVWPSVNGRNEEYVHSRICGKDTTWEIDAYIGVILK